MSLPLATCSFLHYPLHNPLRENLPIIPAERPLDQQHSHLAYFCAAEAILCVSSLPYTSPNSRHNSLYICAAMASGLTVSFTLVRAAAFSAKLRADVARDFFNSIVSFCDSGQVWASWTPFVSQDMAVVSVALGSYDDGTLRRPVHLGASALHCEHRGTCTDLPGPLPIHILLKREICSFKVFRTKLIYLIFRSCRRIAISTTSSTNIVSMPVPRVSAHTLICLKVSGIILGAPLIFAVGLVIATLVMVVRIGIQDRATASRSINVPLALRLGAIVLQIFITAIILLCEISLTDDQNRGVFRFHLYWSGK
jgi:hypothetical protein